MPIPQEFSEKFANEEEFTDRFLMPLLHRMGFSVVDRYHGSREFGKDLVFAEVNQFGHVVYHGLQAKYVGSIGQSDSHGLVEDAREAFANPFKHPHTGATERINTFYAVNGGSIADNAREHFFNSLAFPHGGQVRLLDAKALLSLDRWTSLNKAGEAREMLLGLRLELHFNLITIHRIIQGMTRYVSPPGGAVSGERFKSDCVNQFLLRPISLSGLEVAIMLETWETIDCINRFLDHLSLTTMEREGRVNEGKLILNLTRKLEPLLRKVLSQVNSALSELGTFAAI